MCGLVGFVGNSSCKEPILKGLSRLEYRGYDSAGFATLLAAKRAIFAQHEVGELSRLISVLNTMPLTGSIGIGHTRWATHGPPSVSNAHPHLDCHQSVAVVHNGIIENFAQIKKELSQGHTFTSETDTEVLAHLIESLLLSHSTLTEVVVELVSGLQGAFGIAFVLKAYPDMLIAVRKRSPLCIGISGDAKYVASDQLAFAGEVNTILMMPDESFAFVSSDSLQLFDFAGNKLEPDIQPFSLQVAAVERDGFEHFMLKEIYEQKKIIHKTVSGYQEAGSKVLNAFASDLSALAQISTLHIIACGTSWHAGHIGKYFFEQLSDIKTQVHLASEFRYARFWPDAGAVYLFVSQSGETADTLEAIRMVKNSGGRSVALTNVASSTMARECDGVLPVYAGPEISVASTKAFSGQLAALYAIAQHVGDLRNKSSEKRSFDELLVAAQVLEDTLELCKDKMQNDIAPKYSGYQKMLFVGRQESDVLAQEAALKLKELSYIFADAVPAGELKHGSLALVDRQTPVVLFSSLNPIIYQKLLSCAQEIKARPSKLLVFAFQGQDELVALADDSFVVSKVDPLLGPLAQTGLMQFFAYEIARVLNRPIDKPRNLAKSVTVE